MLVILAVNDDQNFELTNLLPDRNINLPRLSRPFADDLLIGGDFRFGWLSRYRSRG
jgi:hypothetical protein